MKTTVLGLFSTCEETANAANLLKSSGFKNLKINCKEVPVRKESNRGYFGQLFGIKRAPKIEKGPENLVTGIFSKNTAKLDTANKILKEAGAIKVYSFDNMSKIESRSKDFLMKIILLHAKSEIHGSPFINHHVGHEGLTSTT